MRSKVRQITMILLLTILLAPGLMQAQTPARHHSPRSSASLADSTTGSFSAVWNLLSTLFKNGIGLDPSGGTPPPPPGGNTSSAASGINGSNDNGTQLDPSGGPK
ncbi:MAG TPA: hypothetical protein VIE43_18865 [Thermoanaerobaculia bacterium]|jgi:hypothetical protein|nr:hypothetical protein [Thermoanaerobaculia bacterium]